MPLIVEYEYTSIPPFRNANRGIRCCGAFPDLEYFRRFRNDESKRMQSPVIITYQKEISEAEYRRIMGELRA